MKRINLFWQAARRKPRPDRAALVTLFVANDAPIGGTGWPVERR